MGSGKRRAHSLVPATAVGTVPASETEREVDPTISYHMFVLWVIRARPLCLVKTQCTGGRPLRRFPHFPLTQSKSSEQGFSRESNFPSRKVLGHLSLLCVRGSRRNVLNCKGDSGPEGLHGSGVFHSSYRHGCGAEHRSRTRGRASNCASCADFETSVICVSSAAPSFEGRKRSGSRTTPTATTTAAARLALDAARRHGWYHGRGCIGRVYEGQE